MSFPFTTLCPHCSAEHDRATKPFNEPGSLPGSLGPGDFSLCFNCGQWSVLDRNDMLRRPTSTEARRIKHDPRCTRIRAAWLLTHHTST